MSVAFLPHAVDPKRPYHFIGLGGIGMSALAGILLQHGVTVSGSDASPNAPRLAALKAQGATIFAGHHADQLPDNAVVVYSSAIAPDNPERLAAERQGLPLWHRSELLQAVLHGPFPGFQTTVGITGSHGKTSITGMVGQLLQAAGRGPTVMAGGLIPGIHSNWCCGPSPTVAVAELDESDGTLLAYRPHITVLSNLELDHPDHYADGVEALKRTMTLYFENLVAHYPNGDAVVIANATCPLSLAVLQPFVEHLTLHWLGPDPKPDVLQAVYRTAQAELSYYQLEKVQPGALGCYTGMLVANDALLGTLTPGVPGEHNLMNAAMAAMVADALAVPFATAAQALAAFSGMGRRFERVGQYNGAVLIDDYAHHPTEVRATLQAARQAMAATHSPQAGRLWAIFQPHRYSRFETFFNEFLEAIALADEVIVLDVYAAGETPHVAVNSQAFAHEGQHRGLAMHYSSSMEQASLLLEDQLQPGDWAFTLGAGNVTTLLRGLAQKTQSVAVTAATHHHRG